MTPRRHPERWILGLLAVLLCAQQARDVWGFSSRYVTEDHTLLWLAGQELAHFQLRSPNFWGENYLTVFEAIPGAFLHVVGISIRVAYPLGAAILITLAWLVIAFTAQRRGYLGSAVLALALPLVLSLKYLLRLDQLSGEIAGDLLAACAVAAAVGIRRAPLRTAAVIALAGVAFQWDNETVLAGGPAIVAALTEDWRGLLGDRRATLVAVILGLLPPLLWFVGRALWNHAHPDAMLDPGPVLSISLTTLWDNLKSPGTVFGYYAPELVSGARLAEVLMLGSPLLVIAVGIRRRQLTPVAVAVVFLLTVCGVLTIKDTSFDFEPSLYLTGARFVLSMPFGFWLVLHGSRAAGRERADQSSAAVASGAPAVREHQTRPGLVGVTVAVAVISAIVAQVGFATTRTDLLALEAPPNYNTLTIDDASRLLAACREDAAVMHNLGAQIMVTAERAQTYGCAAASGVNTIYPTYDRRYWVIQAAKAVPLTKILFAGGWSCQQIPARLGQCYEVKPALFLLIQPSAPLSQSLAALNINLYSGPNGSSGT